MAAKPPLKKLPAPTMHTLRLVPPFEHPTCRCNDGGTQSDDFHGTRTCPLSLGPLRTR